MKRHLKLKIEHYKAAKMGCLSSTTTLANDSQYTVACHKQTLSIGTKELSPLTPMAWIMPHETLEVTEFDYLMICGHRVDISNIDEGTLRYRGSSISRDIS